MKTNLKPSRRFSAGHHLLKELEARHLTPADLAALMNCSTQIIQAIGNGTQNITARIADDLEKALGIPAHIWLELDKQYQLHMANKI